MNMRVTAAAFGSALLLLAAAGAAGAADAPRVALAVKNQDTKTARALIAKKAGVTAPLPDGSAALHWAAQWDDLEPADLLIAAGADVNAADDFGLTPLSLACTNGDAAMIEKLLQH